MGGGQFSHSLGQCPHINAPLCTFVFLVAFKRFLFNVVEIW